MILRFFLGAGMIAFGLVGAILTSGWERMFFGLLVSIGLILWLDFLNRDVKLKIKEKNGSIPDEYAWANTSGLLLLSLFIIEASLRVAATSNDWLSQNDAFKIQFTGLIIGLFGYSLRRFYFSKAVYQIRKVS